MFFNQLKFINNIAIDTKELNGFKRSINTIFVDVITQIERTVLGERNRVIMMHPWALGY
jgi:hypothetical protein